MKNDQISRRRFIKKTTVAAAGISLFPHINCGKIGVAKPMRRGLGRIGFDVTTLGLGGQASIQWTPEDVDPVKIILKAFTLGLNYFDTSNLYGSSQSHYGKAFHQLDLIPGRPGYDEKKRRSIFITSKTHLRWAKGPRKIEGVNLWTNGPDGSLTIDDLKRTLSQIFGDGKGNYPPGAYVDMVLMHSVSSMADVNVLFTGLENPDPKDESIGALAALLDYRDGTNRTGLNPQEERLVRHLGFSGHHSPAVMMEMIQRDTGDILDGMLVSINPNDRLFFNMQQNVIPVARAKNMGIIGMKIFADGAMYTKGSHWSYLPEHVVRSTGSPDLPSRPLVEYGLSTPGIATAIIGIGQISNDPLQCQLTQNLSAAQIKPESLNSTERKNIEQATARIKEGKTNYFQLPAEPLSPPRDPEWEQNMADGKRAVHLSWHTAFAADEPIQRYDIIRDQEKIGSVLHKPQVNKDPFVFTDHPSDVATHKYRIVTVDASEQEASTDEFQIPAAI